VRKPSVYIFYYINIFSSKLIKKALVMPNAKGTSFPLIPRRNVHHGRYFLEPLFRPLRTKIGVRQQYPHVFSDPSALVVKPGVIPSRLKLSDYYRKACYLLLTEETKGL